MSSGPARGVFIELLRATGEGREPAELALGDGLNVISGASDTGKSHILHCIDYALGASKRPDQIPEAKGYELIQLDLRSRLDQSRISIRRALGGGDVIVRRAAATGDDWQESVVSPKHMADDPDTLSRVLLDLSGFGDVSVRMNKQGKTRTLSFRDIAHLTVISEERIISATPPHLSGQYTLPTAEADVFRTLVTGTSLPKPAKVRQRITPAQYRAQLELTATWIDEARKRLEKRNPEGRPVDEELQVLDTQFAALTESFNRNTATLRKLEADLAKAVRDLRETDSRLGTVQGLLARFNLLDQHYGASVARLTSIAEAGKLLDQFPTSPCIVCGAAPDGHRTGDALPPFQPDVVSEAARAEAKKSQVLRQDLSQTLAELQEESATLGARAVELRSQIEVGRSTVDKELQPRTAVEAESIRKMAERRSELLAIKAETASLELLKRQYGELERRSKTKQAKPDAASPAESTTAEMEGFAGVVEALLQRWKYPDLGRVVFAEGSQDLVVAGQPRGSHGKGVRALTCAAFILGLMKHCSVKNQPHPGLVVLDTPLAVYREPDATKQADDTSLVVAGVKDAFFRSLAAGDAAGQVIVLENEDPPADLPAGVTLHHFSKSNTGRYGFFPVQAPTLGL